jgi:hypothetical protein
MSELTLSFRGSTKSEPPEPEAQPERTAAEKKYLKDIAGSWFLAKEVMQDIISTKMTPKEADDLYKRAMENGIENPTSMEARQMQAARSRLQKLRNHLWKMYKEEKWFWTFVYPQEEEVTKMTLNRKVRLICASDAIGGRYDQVMQSSVPLPSDAQGAMRKKVNRPLGRRSCREEKHWSVKSGELPWNQPKPSKLRNSLSLTDVIGKKRVREESSSEESSSSYPRKKGEDNTGEGEGEMKRKMEKKENAPDNADTLSRPIRSRSI